MRKVVIFAIVVLLVVLVVRCITGGRTPINGYVGTVQRVDNNVLVLTSGLRARLLGVDSTSTSVAMFLNAQFVGKQVELYADSHDNVQDITDPDGTYSVYAVVVGENNYCINRQVVNEYPDCYHEIETPDSGQWVRPDAPLTEKKDLALYMKQRTFLIVTAHGTGTGFFINDDGLALTNWHVLPPADLAGAYAGLYEENTTGSDIQKKRRIKDILWCEDINGLDISVIKVELEDGEKMPYFNIAKRRPNQGDDVATYGNPFEHTASYSKGVISAFRTDPYHNRNVDMVQYDMATNHGNSGGPVCDKYGQVVAVVDVKDMRGDGIGYGIDIMQVRPILDRLGVKYGGR